MLEGYLNKNKIKLKCSDNKLKQLELFKVLEMECSPIKVLITNPITLIKIMLSQQISENHLYKDQVLQIETLIKESSVNQHKKLEIKTVKKQ